LVSLRTKLGAVAKALAPASLLGLRRDVETGHLVHAYRGEAVYLRRRKDRVAPHYADWQCTEIYFRFYRPRPDDVIVDVGTGFGYEAVFLAGLEKRLRYIAVEIQPSVYECLGLTFARLPDGFTAFPLAIGDGRDVRIQPTMGGIDATTISGAGIPIPSLTWTQFCARFGIAEIDFLKVNIEGGEAELLKAVDLGKIKHAAVSCHDFVSDRGGGEAFRTSRGVVQVFEDAGFAVSTGFGRHDFQRFWVYATRPT
jgi:FkbM family methyltransferase